MCTTVGSASRGPGRDEFTGTGCVHQWFVELGPTDPASPLKPMELPRNYNRTHKRIPSSDTYVW